MFKRVVSGLVLTLGLTGSHAVLAKDASILSASYDISRELFAEINPRFAKHWEKETGGKLKIDQSFAGTSRQAQDIIRGKQVDAVSFNQVPDVDVLAERGLIKKDWAEQFPNNSSPYYSTIAFLVRKGNPKNIQGWEDLARDDVSIVLPNPKTSGNARYSYLGAWLYADDAFEGDEEKIKDFVAKVLGGVESFPTGGRGALVSFANNKQGDAVLTFESEVLNVANGEEFAAEGFEVVVPKISVLAEFPVAVVDRVVDRKKTRDVATSYLAFQYSKPIQELIAGFNYRVNHEEVVEATKEQFAPVKLVNPVDVLGPWSKIQEEHFSNNGILDQLLTRGRK